VIEEVLEQQPGGQQLLTRWHTALEESNLPLGVAYTFPPHNRDKDAIKITAAFCLGRPGGKSRVELTGVAAAALPGIRALLNNYFERRRQNLVRSEELRERARVRFDDQVSLAFDLSIVCVYVWGMEPGPSID
jgi:hypothetical protein